MRTQTTGWAATLAGASVLAVAAILAVNGDLGSSASVIPTRTNTALGSAVVTRLPAPIRTEKAEQPRHERTRKIYERMNELAGQLRLEVNRPNPDTAVVADLKARLRGLANRL